MKIKKMIILFYLLLILAIVFQFVSYDWLIDKLIGHFSNDGIIKPQTLKHYKNIFIFFKILAISFPSLSLIFLFFNEKIGNLVEKYINYVKIKINFLIFKITLKRLFWFSLFNIIILAFFAVFNFDIGQDESFFLNDIQNIGKIGAVTRDRGATFFSYDIPSLPLNIVSNITVKLLGFSVIHIRFIILLFSFLLIVALWNLFKEKIGIILIPLIFLLPGVFYLISVVYLETTALLFIILGLIFLKKYENFNNKKDFLLSAFFIAVAMSTKLQLILWVGLILFIMIIVIDYKRKAIQIFKFAITIYAFFGLLFAFSFFHYGIINGITLFKAYFIGGDSGGALNLNFPRLINKSLMLSEIVYLPLFIYIWVKSWSIIKENYNQLYMKFVYVGAIVIVLHWLFFYSAMTWRNVFIGLSFNAVLFALYLKENVKTAKLILVPYILFGIITNYGFIKNGVVDDVQYYRSHVLNKTLQLNSDRTQVQFFTEVKKIIKRGDVVYSPVQPFIPRLFIEDNEINLLQDYIKRDVNQYLIIYPGAIREGYIENRGFTKLLVQSKKLLQKGDYYLYLLP